MTLDAIKESLQRSGGELVIELRRDLDALDLVGREKADSLVDAIRHFEAIESTNKSDAAVFLAAAKIGTRAVECLKAYLLERMLALGLDHLAGPRHECRVQLNPGPSITWPGKPDTIPYAFARTKVELDPNAAKIAYHQGRLPEGFVVTHGRHLRIVV